MNADKKAIAVIAVICTAILPITIAVQSLNTLQTEYTKLFIDPPSLYFETLIPGKRFSVNVTVADVTDLRSYEFKLSFNTRMLDVVSAAFLPEANLPVGNFFVNDTEGVIWMNATYDGDPVTTDDIVAVAAITFRMMDRGTSPLHLYDTTLTDSLGALIEHGTEDGLVMILRRDIAVIYVATSTNETYVGHLVNATVVVENKGDVTENFTVKAYHDDVVFGTFNVTNLAAGANFTIVFSWNTSDVPAGHSYTIKAEASTVPYEANTTNNLLVDGMVMVKIIGDVNADNSVDIDDLMAWDAAYGTHEGEPNWNSQADINGDGEVDKEDGMLIIENYHTTA